MGKPTCLFQMVENPSYTKPSEKQNMRQIESNNAIQYLNVFFRFFNFFGVCPFFFRMNQSNKIEFVAPTLGIVSGNTEKIKF